MFCWQFVHHFSLWQALTWSLFQFFRNLLISSYARGWDKLEWERGWSSPLHPSISWMITTTDSWLWSLHFPPGKKQTGYIIMLTLSREIFFYCCSLALPNVYRLLQAGTLIKTRQGDLSDLCGYPLPCSISQCSGQPSKCTAALCAVITLTSTETPSRSCSVSLHLALPLVARIPMLFILLAINWLCDLEQVTELQILYL